MSTAATGCQDTQRYWRAFNRRMGRNQLPRHLTSVSEWWRLRDREGRNALMYAVDTAGATPELLDLPHMGAQAGQADKCGRTVLFYLVRSNFKLGVPESGKGMSRCGDWMRALARRHFDFNRPARGARGLVIQSMLETPGHQWAGFLAALTGVASILRGKVVLLGAGAVSPRTIGEWLDSDVKTWWGCSDAVAEKAAHWMNEVRFLDRFSVQRLARLANLTLTPEQRRTLPPALRGALLLNDLCCAPGNTPGAIIDAELAAGARFDVSCARLARFRECAMLAVSPASRIAMSTRFDGICASMSAHRLQSVLTETSLATHRARPRM